MYTFDGRIRYSEVGLDGLLTLPALLNYFQDASIFHSEDLRIGVECLQKQNLAWVMNFWQIDIDRFARFGEYVVIGTHPYEFKKFMGFRNFCMLDQEGRRLAVANSLWTLLDMHRMLPVVPSMQMIDAYQLEPKADMEYLSRKIATPKGGEEKAPISVKSYHLDTNNHVNNGQYVAIASDFIPSGLCPDRLRASYHKSAMRGDVFYPVLYELHQGVLLSLNDNEGQPYAMVEFTERTEKHA